MTDLAFRLDLLDMRCWPVPQDRGQFHKRHAFTCPSCGYVQHADINAAVNIRNRYTVLRDGGLLVSQP